MNEITNIEWKRVAESLFNEIKRIMTNLIENTSNINLDNMDSKLDSIKEFTDSLLTNNLFSHTGITDPNMQIEDSIAQIYRNL